MTTARHWRRNLATASLVAASCAALAACNATSNDAAPTSHTGSGRATDGTTAPVNAPSDAATTPTVTTNVKNKATSVSVDTLVSVSADAGSLSDVTVSSPSGPVEGQMSSDGRTWTASQRLEPGTDYTVKAVADNDGATGKTRSSFTTQPLTLAQQTYPTVLPAANSTVGIGMPVVVNFDVPVHDEAAFEKNMHVTSTPAQAGSWHWLSDTEAHWRPAKYWKPGTKVSVDVDVNGVSAGDGIYGQLSKTENFTIGDSHVYKVNAVTHQMQVIDNGKLVRTIPITTGQPGFTTRSGVKVIMEKDPSVDMNSETVGITGAAGYNLKGVQWAMRLTNSGEFIHAAPWSVGSQGYANVSHGCTGMSTDNAHWLFDHSQVGDVVVTTGTGRPMEPVDEGNGYADWNESYAKYKQGSALS